MSDIYIPRTDPAAGFTDYLLGGYHVQAPKFLVDRHPRPSWERERFQSMEANLRAGDILVDVGAEQGQQSAIYARFVGGGQNMVLIEPTPQSWPNIHATWQANELTTPLATYCGFAGAKSERPEHADFEEGSRDGWPLCAYGEYLLDATKFRYLSEQYSSTPTTTLDDFLSERQIIPTALTMDIEGFEISALQGAVQTLKAYRPLVWVSLHLGDNNIMKRCLGGDPVKEVYDLMQALNYSDHFIAEDHERHVVFSPNV